MGMTVATFGWWEDLRRKDSKRNKRTVSMSQEAIVIIDPQKDFISIEGAYAKRHAGISQILRAKHTIHELLSRTNHPRIWTVISDYRIDQFGLGLSLCIPGTEGHKMDILTGKGSRTLVKEAHSCFSSPAFNKCVEKENVTRFILCGFLAEYCVRQTALDGLQKGYEILLLEDAIGTGDDVQHRRENVFRELSEAGAQVITMHSAEVRRLMVTG
jgi:nicotinamidase/pyrazinamidase